MKSKELERCEHAPVKDLSLRAGMRHRILLVAWVTPVDQSLLDELVEDAVDNVVADESKSNENRA